MTPWQGWCSRGSAASAVQLEERENDNPTWVGWPWRSGRRAGGVDAADDGEREADLLDGDGELRDRGGWLARDEVERHDLRLGDAGEGARALDPSFDELGPERLRILELELRRTERDLDLGLPLSGRRKERRRRVRRMYERGDELSARPVSRVRGERRLNHSVHRHDELRRVPVLFRLPLRGRRDR